MPEEQCFCTQPATSDCLVQYNVDFSKSSVFVAFTTNAQPVLVLITVAFI